MMLSENIRNYRKKNNLSQDELAEKLNVTRQSISSWENGQTQPSLENVVALSAIFGISADELLGGSATKYAPTSVSESPAPKKRGKGLIAVVVAIGAVLVLAALAVLLKDVITRRLLPADGPATEPTTTTAVSTVTTAESTTTTTTEATTTTAPTTAATTVATTKPTTAKPTTKKPTSAKPVKSVYTFDHICMTLPENFIVDESGTTPIAAYYDYPNHSDNIVFTKDAPTILTPYTQLALDEMMRSVYAGFMGSYDYNIFSRDGVNIIKYAFYCTLNDVEMQTTQYMFFGATYTDVVTFTDVSGAFTDAFDEAFDSIRIV